MEKLSKVLEGLEREAIIDYCLSRYGVTAETWDGLTFVKRKEGIWLHGRGFLPSLMEINGLESSGLRILSGRSFPYKVTLAFGLFLGEAIQRGRIEVTKEQALSLIRRESLPETGFESLKKGYYFFYHQGKCLGVALKMEKGLVSQVPKSFTAQMPKSLEVSS